MSHPEKPSVLQFVIHRVPKLASDRSGKVMEKATHHGWEQPVLTAVFMVPQCPTFAVGEEGSKPLYH